MQALKKKKRGTRFKNKSRDCTIKTEKNSAISATTTSGTTLAVLPRSREGATHDMPTLQKKQTNLIVSPKQSATRETESECHFQRRQCARDGNLRQKTCARGGSTETKQKPSDGVQNPFFFFLKMLSK